MPMCVALWREEDSKCVLLTMEATRAMFVLSPTPFFDIISTNWASSVGTSHLEQLKGVSHQNNAGGGGGNVNSILTPLPELQDSRPSSVFPSSYFVDLLWTFGLKHLQDQFSSLKKLINCFEFQVNSLSSLSLSFLNIIQINSLCKIAPVVGGLGGSVS